MPVAQIKELAGMIRSQRKTANFLCLWKQLMEHTHTHMKNCVNQRVELGRGFTVVLAYVSEQEVCSEPD